MFKTILRKLEDPKRPLLSPNIKALKFWGLLLPENVFKRNACLILHLTFAIFVVTEYVDIYYVKGNKKLVTKNVKLTLMSTTTLCKAASFLLWQRQWISVIEYVTRADAIQRNSDDLTKKNIITNHTKYCRKMTYFFWSLISVTGVITGLTPVLKYSLSATYRENVKNGTEEYVQVISSWVPFDKNTIPGYLAASVYQLHTVILGCGRSTSFDTSAMVIMVFYKQELELLRIDSSKVYGTESEPVTDGEAKERLKDVHKRHVELLKFARIFDSCLSPVMLVYLLVCSIMLCVTAYQIEIETSNMQRGLIAEYLLFCIAQLFNYCWHSNEVMYTSQNIMLGPYESNWWATDTRKRKDLIILVAQFRKVIVFSAGPFVQLTVPIFISILKGAYSYYTLLSQSQNN